MIKTERIKKLVAVILTVSLLFFYTISPVLIYAQVATPTPTPDPSTSTSNSNSTISDTTTPTPTPDPSAITPTPTPDPSATITPTDTPTPTPTPDPSSTTTNASNSAVLGNTVNSSSVTGDNSLTASDSATTNSSSDQSSSGSSNSGGSVQTGDAGSGVNAQNSVNSTSVNSNVIDQIINIYVTQNGDLNLSDPFSVAASAIQAHPNDPTINISFTNINNYVYLSNDITSSANTGNNTANQSATINTGNAYSVVSLLNQVNFTVLNSQIHIVTINVFGTLNGNIILPNINASTNCSGCGVNILASNSGTLTNNVNSTANTGNNTATGSATITTGDANSVSNILNLLNTNFFGTNAQVLFINVLGNWIGNFIGWGNLGPQQGGTSLAFFNLGPAGSGTNGCSSCSGLVNINSFATVLNNINSTANTGGNSLTGNGSITTGNAFSAVSLINFINSNFINSFGFFGFVNIFGNWTGNIGGLSNFLTLNNGDNNNQNNDNIQSQTNNNTDTNTPQEIGGQLSVTQTNNVGQYVLPGDTVTFSVKVKNTGTGKVYGTKLALFLIYNGQNAGGTAYDIGDINGGSSKQLTTGFVLSKNAPPGLYVARAVAIGKVGPNNGSVSAVSDSSFTLFNPFITNTQPPKTSVLGTTNKGLGNYSSKNLSENMFYFSLMILLTFAYVSMRLVRKRKYIFEAISSPSFKEKIVSMRMLLL